MNLFSIKIAYYDAKCYSLKSRRLIENIVKSKKENTFLFILCPPYCGSTLMHEMLRSSPAVSANNIFGTCEGQSLPAFRQLIDYQMRWSEEYTYPWESIKKIWMNHWDQSKPLLLDKSPPNLIRTSSLMKYFQPSRFIAMTRNPYVHCEALMRRDKMPPLQAAKRSLQCLKHQQQNMKQISDITLVRYEDLVQSPEQIKSQILKFLPTLLDINIDKQFKAHNYKHQKSRITDFNQGKIERLSSSNLKKINTIFKPYANVLHFFEYSLYTP